jgi:predicted dehydrogenase
MNENSELSAVVLGVGYLGRFHAQKYQAARGAKLVGVYDVNREQAQKVANELQVKSFRSLAEALSAAQIATIAASTRFHYELTLQALEAGLHTNVEKPITVTVAEAEELVKIAAQKNLVLTVGHIERFNPVVTGLRERAPTLRHLTLRRHTPFRARGADVDVVLDLMIHDIDLALSFSSSPVSRFSARGHKFTTENWDSVVAHLEFENGMTALLDASRVSLRPQRTLEAWDAKNQWWGDLGTGVLEHYTPGARPTGGDTPFAERSVENFPKSDALMLETQAFIDSVHGSTPLRASGEDGLRALIVAQKIRDALARGT